MRISPMFTWMRKYERAWLPADVIAGVTLAAYLLPAAIGDASLANLPPQAGLYACLFSGLVFWIFCGSRFTSVTVTSSISLVLSTSLAEIAGGDASRFAELAIGTAFLVAAIAFIAWIAKAGVLVHFISESVMTGFKCGVAFFLASTQLPKLFGFRTPHGSFWENADFFFKHLNETNSMSAVVGGVALVILLAGKFLLKNKPVALIVVIGGIIAASVFSLDVHGVKLLGPVPQGIPVLKVPALSWHDLNQLVPVAFACFLLGAVETAAIGRMFVAKHGGRFDANQESLALAVSNFAAGIGGGFPVSGGLSQSLVNESSGARTPLSTAAAAICLLIVVLFFSHRLSSLPQPVLAAVVLGAITGLFKFSTLKQLWKHDHPEFVIAVAAFAGVLTFGLLRGVLIGAAISLVQLVTVSAHPHVALLGRIPGTRRYSDCERHTDNELIRDVMIFRPEVGLFYFNIDYVCDAILNRVNATTPPPKLVVLDLSATPRIDMQSANSLASMATELTDRGIRFHAVEPRSSVRDRLRLEGVDAKLGGVNRFTAVADVVEDFEREGEASSRNPSKVQS
jgi:high affinity sulfate transporter 1